MPPEPTGKEPVDARVRLIAASKTTELLASEGLDVDLYDDDQAVAERMLLEYAKDPVGISDSTTESRVAQLTASVALEVGNLLKEFSVPVVQSATQIRHLVVNKLLIETDNPDARIRIKALELLGKISDVGLFSEKTEITITHKSSTELTEKLRERLLALTAIESIPPVAVQVKE